MAHVEMTKAQAVLAEKFRPHFGVLSKPMKATWADISKAIKFVSKKGLGTVSIAVVDGAPDLNFSPAHTKDADNIVLAMHGKNKISLVKKSPEEKTANKIAKLDKKAVKASEGVRDKVKKVKKATKKAAKAVKKTKVK